MTLEERIVMLIKSMNVQDNILGATLLNSIGNIEEEIRIFELACDSDIGTGFGRDSEFLSLKKVWKVYHWQYQQNEEVFYGDRWSIHASDLRVYMMKSTRNYESRRKD